MGGDFRGKGSDPSVRIVRRRKDDAFIHFIRKKDEAVTNAKIADGKELFTSKNFAQRIVP